MRVAVLSDIHGFSLALDTVIADLEAHGPFDEIVVAGDLCEVGPDPAGVLRRLRASSYAVLTGNTDADIVEAAISGDARGSAGYAIAQIGSDGVDYLAELPFSRRVRPPESPSRADDLLIVHANPRNLLDRITPDASDRELHEVIGDEPAGAIAFGHYHVCFMRRFGSTLLVDVSAVGNPKDGDLRCKYGILTWDPGARVWTAELRKLPYPIAATETQILESGLPNPHKAIEKLNRASYAS
jgi:predicted phosphodiesterase